MSTDFDREISLRGVLWTGAALAAATVLAALLMWWLLRGFSRHDEKRDVRLTPIEVRSPEQPPPEPRLQVSPSEDLRRMRAEEERLLHHAAWVDRRQGIVRVPVDVALDVIAIKGVAGAQAASPAQPSPPQPSSPRGRGGRTATPSQPPVPPSPSGREGSGE
jgi:hypothetical protein